MNCKKVVVLGLLMLLFTLTYGTAARATSEERWIVYEMDSLGLEVSIEAPYLADPGENITVTVITQASGASAYGRINIYGQRNETEAISLADIPIQISTVPYQGNHTILIPNDTSPGLLYGIIEWEEWSVQFPGGGMKVTIENPPPAGFVVTYVKNVKLEELQAAYDQLNATYNSLLANYTKMKNYKSELGSTRNVMYIFVATTIVSAATAFILLVRRPKKVWT